ncbi:MAG TPA: prolyl oligopeptidase family serine peptidase [Streptosporangiaceae bacterium]|nr:prolyl oligopeptidase family serine peptidase [Streptosporangiaceae bacterium]
MKTAIAVTLALAAGVVGGPVVPAAKTSMPAPPGLAATDVSFRGGGGLTLHGTVLTQRRSTREAARPGVVLVTGSGSGVPREHLLTEATEFARRGLAVLIYDKRSAGYTGFRRSYSELADDALGAVRELRAQPGVDPAKVGVWGLSEGGWVAPLAASRSADVAFVIVVGGNAMTPIRQQTWNEASALRRRGVSGSLVERANLNLARLAADVGLFAEARYDAAAVLERLRQPLLGVWGGRDLQTPPEDNPPLFAAALRRGGNSHYTFRFFPGADHAAHQTPDGGVTRGAALAPGYAEAVTSWVREVTNGRPPAADAPSPPKQDHPSSEVAPLAWWESPWAQLAAFALFVVGFLAYPLIAFVRRLRGRRMAPVSRSARLLAGAGILTAPGMFAYLLYLTAAGRSPGLGPIVFGRPLPWLVLQWFAVTAAIAAVSTTIAWWRAGRAGRVVRPGERVRLGLLLAAGAVFIPWAGYWGLLLP